MWCGRPIVSRHSIAARRQPQLGRPSASGSGSSRCVEWRFDVTHSSRSRRNVSEAREVPQSVTMARSSSLASMRSTRSTDGSHDHGQLDARIGAREARHDLGQIAVGVIVRHAEPHAAGELGVVEGGERLDVELDDAARVIEQPLAVLGELGGAAVAREDRLAEPLLQPLHLHRHRRLGLVHDLGGLGEAAGLDDGDEGAQLVDVDQGGHGVPPECRTWRPGDHITIC